MKFTIAYQDTASLSDADGARVLAEMTPDRRVRIGSMSAGGARRLSLLAELLARGQAARLLGGDAQDYRIQDGPGGKPLLLGGEAYVSLSHAGTFAAAAAARMPVGVDIERLRPIPEAVLRRVCSAGELAFLKAAGEAAYPTLSLRLWTMKEAWGKLSGVGVFTSRRFICETGHGGLQTDYADCVFTFHDAPPGYLLTSCLAREETQVHDMTDEI